MSADPVNRFSMHADWLLVVAWDLPIEIPAHTLQTAMEDVQRRLECPCRYLDLGPMPGNPHATDPTPSAVELESKLLAHFRQIPLESTARVVIVPLGLSLIPLGLLRSAWWFASWPCNLPCLLAEPLSYRELGQWIAQYQMPKERTAPAHVSLFVDDSARSEAIEAAVSTAYWASRSWTVSDAADPVRVSPIHPAEFGESTQPRDPASQPLSPEQSCGEIPWDTGVSIYDDPRCGRAAPCLRRNDQTEPWDWCRPSSISNWMVSRYLSGVRSRPLPIGVSTDWFEMRALDAEWCELNRLQHSLDSQLPTEYSGKLDAVSPNSMGSASLRYDADGLVPWDQIWTSFCDLAMAGGPPHRGKLLEAATAESIAQSPDRTAAVVSEIRRGIGLASGLSTLDSPYAGWVAIACDDESMAAWLLRAILVENVAVRREGSVLYVPAGPDYRVDKEIKNVITSVAKTVHYWRAHLRSRQPPKPL
jgi:hypothetical protein